MKSAVIAGDTPDSWSADSLFLKAQRYIEKMQADDPTEWSYALWSGLALELLARAALASISPALLADTSDRNWSSLLHSLGFTPTEPKFSPRSIAVSEAAKRLGQLVPDFDKELENFCIAHTGKRNSELHSGELPFDGVQSSGWQPNFYRACKVLLASMGLGLKDLVGENEAEVAQKLIDASLDDKAKAVQGDLERHAKAFFELSEDERRALIAKADVWATRQSGHRVRCPACGSSALVHGDAISAPTQTLENDMIKERQEHLPDQFQCVACDLKISGLSRLAAMGLADRYTRTTLYDAAEYYAPEDVYQGYEEDNNEPF